MAAIGGSVESVMMDGRIFPVAADADTQRKLGGFENDVQANGDGTGRLIKTRVPLSITGLTVEIDDSQGDHEFLQRLMNRNDYFPFAITYASGVTYQGRAQITGEVQVSNNAQTASINIMGPGILTKQ